MRLAGNEPRVPSAVAAPPAIRGRRTSRRSKSAGWRSAGPAVRRERQRPVVGVRHQRATVRIVHHGTVNWALAGTVNGMRISPCESNKLCAAAPEVVAVRDNLPRRRRRTTGSSSARLRKALAEFAAAICSSPDRRRDRWNRNGHCCQDFERTHPLCWWGRWRSLFAAPRPDRREIAERRAPPGRRRRLPRTP